MQAVVDSRHGDYFRCLLENGDVINVYKNELSDEIGIGDIVKVTLVKDNEASARQRELMK
jgi:exosome complex RNA-binding protein Csl4